MSKHYSAFQYNAAFRPKALRNWEVPKFFCDRPRQRTGETKIIANATGNLLPGVHRSEDSPWGNFIGTWSMPKKIDRKTAAILNGSADFKAKAQKCYIHYTTKPRPRTIILEPEEDIEDANVEVKPPDPVKAEISVPPVAEIAEEAEVSADVAPVEQKPVTPKLLCPIHDI